jgi:hypothetical protein
MKLIVAGGLLSMEAMFLYTETMLYAANSSWRTVVYGSYCMLLYTETVLYEANSSRRTVVCGSYVVVYRDYVV